MAEEVLYFISDTHLGDGSGADRFLYPQQLMDLLERINEEQAAHLVLLGDFMELWASSLEAVLVKHASVFHKIGRLATIHPVTYVVGNHDCLPWYYFLNQGAGRITVTERFTGGRGTLVAVHGHQFDPFNRVQLSQGSLKIPWTRKLVQVVGFLGRVGGQEVGEKIADTASLLQAAADSLESLANLEEDSRRSLRKILDHESPGERGYPEGERAYEEGAHNLMRQGARFVVMGHTHHPLTRFYGGRTYVNTGSWVSNHYPPTYARFAGGRLELLEANTHRPYEPRSAES